MLKSMTFKEVSRDLSGVLLLSLSCCYSISVSSKIGAVSTAFRAAHDPGVNMVCEIGFVLRNFSAAACISEISFHYLLLELCTSTAGATNPT